MGRRRALRRPIETLRGEFRIVEPVVPLEFVGFPQQIDNFHVRLQNGTLEFVEQKVPDSKPASDGFEVQQRSYGALSSEAENRFASSQRVKSKP